MFTHLNLENFKSWKSADVEFGRVTGLFGTNSSGKTSLIQFLLLLKQTKEASDRNTALDLNGPYVALGTMADAIFGHDKNLCLYYRIGMKLDDAIVVADTAGGRKSELTRSDKLTVAASIRLSGRTPEGDMLEYQLGSATFKLTRKPGKPHKYNLDTEGLKDFRFNRPKGRAWDLPGPIKSYRFPDQARTYYKNAGFLSDLEYAFEKHLDQLYYLGPLREDPRRDYLWAHSKPTDVGKRGEKAIDAILAAQADGERRNLEPKARLKKFPEMVAHWLKEMGLIQEFRLDEIAEGSNRWQVKVKKQLNSPEVLLTDVGFGVSQVLPVITLLYYVPKGSTVVLEQPEIHLHPLAQAELADLIISVSCRRNVQIILESHSEHLLLRLQRRIAEGLIPSNDIRLYFCEASKGCSTIRELRLDLMGNIKNWPDQFMGDAFTETAEAEMARLLRAGKTAP
ncbi:MAG: DUF3696 domain-containing protein [Rhodobacteraceae bacterium]|nr:DUF3696 domain-containing protein [Paracoccaceae bacterium]